MKKDLDHDLDLLYKIDSVKKYDKQTLINIYSAVSSRNFGWDFNGKNEMLLVTYIDLVNNGKNKNSNWYFDSKKNSFCLKTIKNIKENEEIFDEYGSLIMIILNVLLILMKYLLYVEKMLIKMIKTIISWMH